MAVSADIFTEQERWSGPLVGSVVLHTALFAAIAVYSIFGNFHRGNEWGENGTGGGAMSATLVTTVPLPSNPDASNVVANESKGLSQTLPTPKVQEQEPDAIPIPARNARNKPAPKAPPQSVTPPKPRPKPQPVEEASNVVPFGEGGPVSGPYGVFSAGGAKGGLSFGGGGDFGSRFGWYVDVVRRKVSDNWLKYEIDPHITSARRVYISFIIRRDGSPAHVQIEQSSGVPSLDQSAVRALQRIDTFGPLPGDYSGSQVGVEFWFDYRR